MKRGQQMSAVFGHSGTESHCNSSEVSLERSVQSGLGLSVKNGSHVMSCHVMLGRIFHWWHGTWQVSEPPKSLKWLLANTGYKGQDNSLGPLL